MSQAVRITKTGAEIHVEAPYNSGFIAAMKWLSAKWSGERRVWALDQRDEARVRELCRKWYGGDGLVADTCTIRVEWPKGDREIGRPIEIHGRTIAKASGRDSGACASDGVVVLEKGFTSGGSRGNWGSRGYWTTEARPGTVVLVRDFPRTAAQELIGAPVGPYTVSIEDEAPQIDYTELAEERQRLVARIAEIDALLTKRLNATEEAA
jgi:hypothetical protein